MIILKGSIYLTESILLRKKTRKKSDRIPLAITNNRFLPTIIKIITKNWNILKIDKNLKEIFKNEPIAVFKRNRNMNEIIGTHWIENRRVKKNFKRRVMHTMQIKSW